jgi:hypothetical protein
VVVVSSAWADVVVVSSASEVVVVSSGSVVVDVSPPQAASTNAITTNSKTDIPE